MHHKRRRPKNRRAGCRFTGCNRPYLAKGWCSAHYQQVRAGKTPSRVTPQRPLHDRLWGRVNKSGPCWLWLGATNDKGYGLIGAGRKGKLAYVHRVSFEDHGGRLKPDQEVCHSCDTPNCVNPAHLFAGTHAENMLDMARKGRANKKLTEPQVREVVRLRQLSIPRKDIVERTGIKLGTLKDILRGKNWKHVTGGPVATPQ